ncbi:MAG: DUF1947 domain-containing protein [Candidatus Bathyarchaeia archaeon]
MDRLPRDLRRYQLKEKELRKLTDNLDAVLKEYALEKLVKGARIELAQDEKFTVIFIDNKPAILRTSERPGFPVLSSEIASHLPVVVVDMGAIAHVCSGADVMVPGISSVEGNFERGSLVLVIDEKHHKPLAICRTLLSSTEIEASERGKAAENLHFVGDSGWKLVQGLGANI